MNKVMSALAAVATVATAPAALAIPQSADAAVRVVVGAPGAGFYFYGGRHYRHRVWRQTRWYYYDPVVVGPAYGYGYDYGYRAPVYYGHRYYGHRYYGHGVRCHAVRYGYGRVCR